MNGDEPELESATDSSVERGETYVHASHGRVEVTGIWEGTRWVDAVPPPDERDADAPILVRYVPPDGDDWSDERSATLSDFRDAVDR